MWKITSVASFGASAARSSRSLVVRSPWTSRGGSCRATSTASRRISSRYSIPGQTSSSSQRIWSSSVTSIGSRSRPARQAISGSCGGSGGSFSTWVCEHRRPVAEPVAVVVVAVAVGQQAQPRARAHLEQRQRLRQLGQQREHQRAAGRPRWSACGARASRPRPRRAARVRIAWNSGQPLGVPATQPVGRRTAGSAGACRPGRPSSQPISSASSATPAASSAYRGDRLGASCSATNR